MYDWSLEQWIRLACCFLLGSIPFAVITMLGTGIDIRKYGSGNPGFNNVLRYSKWRAAFCLLGDVGKGMAAMALMNQPLDPPLLQWAGGIMAILGHTFSPFLGFRGGKGVATAAGVMVYKYPLLLVCSVILYIALRLIGGKRRWPEPGTIASLTSAVFFCILLGRQDPNAALMGFLLVAFIAWRHKKNLIGISAGSQSRS